MARGIEGKDIFADKEDRENFLQILTESFSIAGHRCYAWVLMRNHYHFLVRCSEEPLGIMMRRLNSKYARYFSVKYNRRGYLFQDRYKSIATQDAW
jgi:REP element-mobilizing transposase RayT